MGKLTACLEVYKCITLTVIAVLLFLVIGAKGPASFKPLTWGDFRSNPDVERDRIPLVRIQGGHVDVQNTVEVEIKR